VERAIEGCRAGGGEQVGRALMGVGWSVVTVWLFLVARNGKQVERRLSLR
jgi:hypothetical protein